MEHRFSYIDKASDLTLDMVNMYKDSFILLGDEKQLFHPLTSSYVGLGQSAYNYILSKLANISDINVEIQVVDIDEWFNITMNNTDVNGFSTSYTSTVLKYNPFKETLKTAYFDGTLRGLAYYSTIAYYSNIAYNNLIKNTNTNQSYYLTFSNTNINNTNSYSYTNNNLIYNPYEKTLMSEIFDGQVDPEDQWGIMGEVSAPSFNFMIDLSMFSDSILANKILLNNNYSFLSIKEDINGLYIENITNYQETENIRITNALLSTSLTPYLGLSLIIGTNNSGNKDCYDAYLQDKKLYFTNTLGSTTVKNNLGNEYNLLNGIGTNSEHLIEYNIDYSGTTLHIWS